MLQTCLYKTKIKEWKYGWIRYKFTGFNNSINKLFYSSFFDKQVLYKPVVKLLDERAEKIKKGLDDAETASKNAENAAEKIEELAKARQEGKS